ncbi:MAG: ribonuclease R [Meiothermus sp.]|nr:ribonuclease R [Meiothermus sp.]
MTEQIYEHLKKHPKKPFSLREIARHFRLEKSEAREALELLVAEGRVSEPRRQLYQLPEGLSKKGVEGRVQAHPAGFAFVLPADPDTPDLYIPKGHLHGAWHGDLVRAVKKPPGRDGKPWGVVDEIVERGHKALTGRLYFSQGFAWLAPDDGRFPRLKLEPKGLEDLEAGARLSVRVIFPEGKNRKPAEPYGELQAYLGEGEGPEVETEAVIAKYELLQEFSPEALEEAERVAVIGPKDLLKRTDFRGLRVFTIDGSDAKDFDDAIHVRELESGNLEVGVHIADVSHYVREFTPLDRDAYDRATSVYLPGRVLPMLPERLSNGMCSLVPHEDRLVLSVVAEVTPKGRVKDYKFHQGVIRSVARLTYEQVEGFADSLSAASAKEGKGAGGSRGNPSNLPSELHQDLTALLELTAQLKHKRLEKGALDFHFTEVKVQPDDEGNLHLISQREPKARSLIEELMLLANRTVAKHLSEREIPALFRVHEDPSEEAYNKLVTALGRMGYSLPGGELSPKALQNILRQAEGRPEAPAISTLLLRSLRLARYAAENLGHFGLAAEHYLHFTSPIRRYPDLVVHRVLKTLLGRKVTAVTREGWAERFPKLAEHTSSRERAAEGAERELTKYYQCLWAEAHKGEVWSGTVSGVAAFGVFVALENGVEGMIRLGALEDDHYHYVEELLSLEGVRTKRRIRIGDTLEVEIAGANPAARQIDFAVTEGFYSEGQEGAGKEEGEGERESAKGGGAQPKRSGRPGRRGPAGTGKAGGGQGSGKKENVSSRPEPTPKAQASGRPKGRSRVASTEVPKRKFEKPVKVSARKIYFGEWTPEAAPTGQDASVSSPKKGKGRRSRKTKR